MIEIKSKLTHNGNSLVVQWLGLSTFTAMDPGLIPDWGTKMPQASWHGQKTATTDM